MASLITLKGIDQAISNLNYQNKKLLKYRLVTVLRQFYKDEGSIESLRDIGADELIELLWGIADDPASTKKKRKNLSRIRYSVNADLKTLYRQGKNPEGIIIGPANAFTMSDEAKDRVLKSLLAEKISGEEPDAGIAELDYGLLEKTESGQQAMNEKDILRAIEELDEDYLMADLEKVEADNELGERTLDAELEQIETPQEMQAVSAPVEATGKAKSEAEQERAFAEGMGDEEGLGEIAFDPEETQYLTVPEDETAFRDLAEDEAPGGISGSQDTMDDQRAPSERPDFMSTTDSEEKALQEKTQGVDARSEPVQGKAQDKREDHSIEAVHQETKDEEGLGEIAFDPEETQYLTVPEDEALPPDLTEGEAQGGTGPEDTMDDQRAASERPDFMSTADSEEKATQPEYPKTHAGKKEASGKGAKKKGSAQVPAPDRKAKRAIKQMEETLARRPNDIGLLQQLAQAKESSGDLQAALSLYQKIIDLSPGEESAEEACLRLSLKLLDKKE
jgi:hypothetical protein